MTLTLSVFIGVSLLIVAIAIAIRINITGPAEKTVGKAVDVPVKVAETAADFGKHAIDRASEAFVAIFQSKINVVSSATVCDATSIAELALLQGSVREIIDYSDTKLGSTKRIIAEQHFIAKIGFDLQAKFSVSCDALSRTITFSLPEPKILSLETSNPAAHLYLNESGWINKLNPEDHQRILIQLKNQARQSVDATLAIKDAKQLMETRLNDLFQSFDARVVVLFPTEQTKVLQNA